MIYSSRIEARPTFAELQPSESSMTSRRITYRKGLAATSSETNHFPLDPAVIAWNGYVFRWQVVRRYQGDFWISISDDLCNLLSSLMASDPRSMTTKTVLYKFYQNSGYIPAMLMDSNLESLETNVLVHLLRTDFPCSEPPIVPPVAGCLACFFTEGRAIPQGGKNFERRF